MYTVNTNYTEDALNGVIKQRLPAFRAKIVEPVKSVFGFSVIYGVGFQEGGYYILVENEELLTKLVHNVDHGTLFCQENMTSFLDGDYSFLLWPDIPSNMSMQLYFKYNQWNGVTILKLHNGMIEIWALTADKFDNRAQDFFRRNKDVLMRVVHYFNNHKSEFVPDVFTEKNIFRFARGFDFSIPPVAGYDHENQKVQILLNSLCDKLCINTDKGLVKLTAREMEIFSLLAEGQSAKHIARELGGSYRTVEKHVESIKEKTGVHRITELIRFNLGSMNKHLAIG